MSRFVLSLALLATVAACTKAPTTKDLAAEAAAAMGGAERLRSIQTLQMRGGTGSRLRLGQTVRIADTETPASLANVIETADLANGRAALDYQIDLGGFRQHRQEVLTKQGDALVGLENVEGRPLAVMSASGLFSWGTQNHPSFLLRRNIVTVMLAAMDTALDEAPQTRDLDGVTVKQGRAVLPSGDAVTLYFDPTSKLLHAFETLDTESMLGDVPARYLLSDYRDVSGVRLPHTITITKAGAPYANVRFSTMAINDAAALAVFTIPDAAQAQVDVAIAAGDYSPIELVPVAPGVTLARAYSHNSMVVEFDSFLAVVEAPYTEAQSTTLVRMLATAFPNKPVRYVAVTHHHSDHIGGVRGMAAAGASTVVEQGHAPPLNTLLAATHRNPPDELTKRRQATGRTIGTVESYNGMRTIAQGTQALQLRTILGDPHSDPIVLAYVPSAGVLFQSDLWFPGLGAPASPDAVHMLRAIESMALQVKIHVGGHGGIGPHDELVKAAAGAK